MSEKRIMGHTESSACGEMSHRWILNPRIAFALILGVVKST